MYNEEQKKNFINSYTDKESTVLSCIAFFQAIEQHEIRWGADICTRQKEDIIYVLEETTGIRTVTKAGRLSILKKYLQWCLQNNIPGAIDSLKDVDKILGYDKLRTHTVANPRHLQMYLDTIFNPESENGVDNTFRCYFWLAYGGMAEEDIFTVTVNDIDLRNMIVKYKTTEIPIYKEAIQAFRNCVELDAFQVDGGVGSKYLIPRVTGSLLLRGTKGETKIQGFRVSLSRCSKKAIDFGKTDMKLSYFRVWLSGLFYRMHENEQIGIEPDFLPIAWQLAEGKTYKLDKGRNTVSSRMRRHAAEYMEDYLRWKFIYKN